MKLVLGVLRFLKTGAVFEWEPDFWWRQFNVIPFVTSVRFHVSLGPNDVMVGCSAIGLLTPSIFASA